MNCKLINFCYIIMCVKVRRRKFDGHGEKNFGDKL